MSYFKKINQQQVRYKEPVHHTLFMATRVHLHRALGWTPTSTGIRGWFPA